MRQHERGPAFGWPDDALTLLKARWTEGASASAIAAELGQGVTRNAVIGKISRLKLPKRATKVSQITAAQRTANRHGNFQQPKANAIVAKALQRQAPSFPSEPYDVEDTEGVDVTHLVGILDLEHRSCRWPVKGEGSATLFCGVHTNQRPYCDAHRARAGIGYGKGPRP